MGHARGESSDKGGGRGRLRQFACCDSSGLLLQHVHVWRNDHEMVMEERHAPEQVGRLEVSRTRFEGS